MDGYLNAPYVFILKYNSATILRNVGSIVSSALNGFVLAAFNFSANLVTGVIILSLIYLKYFKISLLIGLILTLSTIFQNILPQSRKSQKIGRIRDNNRQSKTKSLSRNTCIQRETKVHRKETHYMNSFKNLNNSTIANDSQNMLLTKNTKPHY